MIAVLMTSFQLRSGTAQTCVMTQLSGSLFPCNGGSWHSQKGMPSSITTDAQLRDTCLSDCLTDSDCFGLAVKNACYHWHAATSFADSNRGCSWGSGTVVARKDGAPCKPPTSSPTPEPPDAPTHAP